MLDKETSALGWPSFNQNGITSRLMLQGRSAVDVSASVGQIGAILDAPPAKTYMTFASPPTIHKSCVFISIFPSRSSWITFDMTLVT